MNEAESDQTNNFDQKLQGSYFSSFQNDFLKQGHDGDDEIIKFDRVNSNKSLEKRFPQKIINFDSQDQTQMSRSLQYNQDKMNIYDSQFESPQFQQQLESFIQSQEQNKELQQVKANKKVSEMDYLAHIGFESQGSSKSLQLRRVQKRFSNQNYLNSPKNSLREQQKFNNERDVLKASYKNVRINESLTSLKNFSILSPNATQNNLIGKKYENFSFVQHKDNKKDLSLATKNSQVQIYTYQQSYKIEKALKIIQHLKNTRFNQVTRVQSIVERFVKLLLIFSGKHQISFLQEHQFEQVNDLSSFYQEKVQTGLLNKIKSYFRFLFSKCSFNMPVIMPSQIFAIAWDIFLVLYTLPTLMIYSVLTFCAPHQPDEIIYIEIFKVMLFLFIIDIILNFNFAHFSQDAIVVDRKLIAKKYLKQNFFTDATTTIVLFSKIYFSELPLFYNPDDSFVIYLINCLVFLKFKSIAQKTSRFDEIMQSKESQKHKLRLLKLIIQIVLIAHAFAIGWNIMAIIENNNGIQNTWLSQKDIQNDSWITKYIYSFYWCITTMTTVGFGDIVPTNQYEYLFMSMAMIFMSCNFAYTISNVGLILSEIEKNKRELNNCISNIQRQQNQNRNAKIRYNPRLLIEINKKLQKRLKENSIHMESKIRLLFNTDTNEEKDSESDATTESLNDKLSSNEQNNILSSQLQILQHVDGINKVILQNNKADRRKSQFLSLKQQATQQDDFEKDAQKLKNYKFQKLSNPSFQSFQDISKANEHIIFQDQFKNEKFMTKFQNTINEIIENNSEGSEKSIEQQIQNNQNQLDQIISNKKHMNSKDSFKLDSEFMLNSNVSQENAIHSPRVLNVSPTNQINQFQDFQDIVTKDFNQYQSNQSTRKQKQRYATQPPQTYNQYASNILKIENKNLNVLNHVDSQKQIREKTKSLKVNNEKGRQKIFQSNAIIVTQAQEKEKQEYKKRCSIEFSNRRQSKFQFNGQLQSFQHLENKGSSSNIIRNEDSLMKIYNSNKMEDSQINRFNTIKMEDSQQIATPFQNPNQIDLKSILLLNQLGKRNNNNIQQLDKQTFSKYFYKFSFESMKIYKVFFPHNNYNKVIQNFRICQIHTKKQKKHKNFNQKKQKINQKDNSLMFNTGKGNTEFSNIQLERASYNDLNYKPSYISYGVALKKNFKLHPSNNLKNLY
ncbi:hypothetical protein ABPG74_011086 [Tetrahymena malaccensis]